MRRRHALATLGGLAALIVAGSPAPQGASPLAIERVRMIEADDVGPPGLPGLPFPPDARVRLELDVPRPGAATVAIRSATATPDERVELGDAINLGFARLADGGALLVAVESGGSHLVEIRLPAGGAAPQLRRIGLSTTLRAPRGVAVDPLTGNVLVLDHAEIVRFEGGVRLGAAPLSGPSGLRGLALDPSTGHVHVLNASTHALLEFDASGVFVGARDLSPWAPLHVRALSFAPSLDRTDDPARHHLYMVGTRGKKNRPTVTEWSLDTEAAARSLATESSAAASSAATAEALADVAPALVQIIEASEFDPPSPDSAGLAYQPDRDSLLMSDSEVNEMSIYEGVNVFEMTRLGVLFARFDTEAYSDEPTGLAIDLASQTCFVSDDTSPATIFILDPGADGRCFTSDDSVSSFPAEDFDSGDPEGLAFGAGDLFVVDGVNAELYRIDPGPDGIFEGPADGDDEITACDTSSAGIDDPEGAAYHAGSNTLFLAGKSTSELHQISPNCELVRTLDVSGLDLQRPAGLALAPGSVDPTTLSLWLADRGVDNDSDSDENDGRIYEFSLPFLGGVNPLLIVSAGPDLTIRLSDQAVLLGSVSDDGPPSLLTSAWTAVSGPGSVFFEDASQPATAASFSEAGTYVLRLTGDNGSAQSSDQTTVTVTGAGGFFQAQISADDDDAEEAADGSVALGSSDLELVDDGGFQTVGLRFTGVALPPGANILAASLRFVVDEESSEPTTLEFRAEAADSASPFVGSDDEISGRALGSESVSWNPVPWSNPGTSGADQETPDLAALVQEVVDRPGWQQGNALAVVVRGSGRRVAVSHDGDPADAPVLRVDFESQSSEPPTVSIQTPSDGSVVSEGSAVTFAATASDPEDGDISDRVLWSSDRDGGLGSGASLTRSDLSGGAHRITAVVADDAGLTAVDQIGLTVLANSPPVVSIATPPDGASVTVGSPVTFAGSALDLEDGDLSADLVWASSLDGVLGSGASVSRSDLSLGQHLISASVVDEGGLPASASRTFTVTMPQGTVVVERRVEAAEDDAEEDAGGSVQLSSSDLELVTDGDPQTVGLRFTGIDVPPGATILEAWIQFTVDEDSSEATSLILQAQAADDAAAFSESPGDVSGRPVGDASLAWDPPSWSGGGTAGAAQRTPDLGALLREVLQRPGWSSGNAVAILVRGSGRRVAVAYDGDPAEAALLHVSYVESNETPSVTIIAPPDGTVVGEGTSVVLVGSASDPEDGDLSASVVWSSSLAGPLGTGASVFPSLGAGAHTISASVSDNLGLAASDRISLTVVAQSGPVVSITAPPDGTTVDEGDPVTLAGTALDAEDGNLSSALVWSSDRDGPLGTGASVTRSDLTAGPHVVTAGVTDDDGLLSSASIGLFVASGDETLVVERRITAGADDAEEQDDASVDLSSSDLELVLDGSAQLVGLRFPGLAVPRRATVLDAWVRFEVDEATSEATDLVLRAQAVDSAAPFTGTDADLSARLPTTAAVPWSPPAWLITGASGAEQQSPDLRSLIQEVIDRDGWSEGNALAILVNGSGHRVAVSFDGDPNGAALLYVAYLAAAPDVSISAPEDGAEVVAGSLVSFSGSAFDLEDGDLSAQLAWTSSLDGSLGNGATVVRADLSPGTHTITASVTDSSGLGSAATISLLVSSRPQVTIVSPDDGSAFIEEDLIDFVATATDPEEGDLSSEILWESDRDGVLATGPSFSASDLTLGTHIVRATVSDSQGLDGSDHVTLAVSVNTPPVVTITSPPDGSALPEGAPALLAASADDLEDGDLSGSVSWVSSLDGVLGTGATLTLGDLSPGVHQLSAVVADRRGLGGSDEITFEIEANVAPQVTILTPPDGYAGTAGDPITLVASALDPEDGDLAADLLWTSSLDGSLGSGASLTLSDLAVGSHALSASVADQLGAVGSAAISLTVEPNEPPAVAITDPEPGSTVAEGAVVVLAALATDPEDGDLGTGVTWSSDRNGVLGVGASIAVSTLSQGAHQISARVEDHLGAPASASVDLTVNGRPVVLISAPEPGATVTEGDPVLFSAAASDPEDGDLSAALSWTSSIDGALGSGPSLTRADLSIGEHHVAVSVSDQHGLVASAVVVVHVSANAPPELAITAPTNGDTVTFGEAVSLIATATDAEDGDLAQLVAWSSDQNGSLGTGATVVRSDLRAGVHSIRASVSDRHGVQSNDQIALTVDVPPVVTIQAPPNGTTVAEGDAIELAATASDNEDGDLSASIVWSSDRDDVLGSGSPLTVSNLSVGPHQISALVTDSAGATRGAEFTLIVNAAPVVTITAPTDGTVVVAGDPLTLIATAVDAEDGDLSADLSWLSDVDGPLGTGPVITRSDLTPGIHQIVAQVTDGSGLGASEQVAVEVDQAPVVTISAPVDGSSATAGDAVTLTASASDPEDGDLSGGLVWSSDRDGSLGTGPTVVRSDLSIGPHEIRASVTDQAGTTRSDLVTLRINAAPGVVVTAPPDGTTVTEGDAVTFTGSATDVEDGDISSELVWTSDLDGALGAGASVTRGDLTVGFHTIRASVTDSLGIERDDQIGLTVAANAPPVLAITAPADGSASSEGDPVTFQATASDPEDGNLAEGLAWESSLAGPLGTGASITRSDLALGTHTITARVSDRQGLEASGEIVLTVNLNAPPVVVVTAPASGTVLTEGDPVALSASAIDPEEGDLSADLVWTSSLDGSLGGGAGLTLSSLSLGTHIVTASLQDSKGASGSDEITLTVEANTPPSVQFGTPADGSSATEGDPITFTATASDAQEGDLSGSLAWSSDRDGSFGSGASVTRADLSIGVHTITAAVSDGGGLAASASLTLTVNANTPPVVTITDPVSGSSTTEALPVTFTATALDGEQGDLSAALEWSSNLDGPLGGGPSVTRTDLSVGSHTITARVLDRLGAEATAQIVFSVFPNQAPDVTISSPGDGASVSELDLVVFSGTALDPEDGDLSAGLTWVSDLDGVLGSGASVTRSNLSVGLHAIEAAVADGDGRVGSAQIELTVTPNTAPVVAITMPTDGTSVPQGSELTLSGTATDAEDGDLSAELSWVSTKDGVLGTGATLVRSDLSLGAHRITASVTDRGGLQSAEDLNISITLPDGAEVVDTPVAAGEDDAEESPLGDVTLDSSDLELVFDSGEQVVGIRFDSVAVPLGATVLEAWIQFTVDEETAEATSLRIRGEPSDHALPYQELPNDVSARPRTTASVAWTPDPWPTAGEADLAQRTPDLSSIVQEIVDREGWWIGNGMAFTFDGTGLRVADSFDADPQTAPVLHVGYLPGPNTPPQVVPGGPPDATVISEGEPVTFSASAFDADDGDITDRLAWVSDRDGALGSGSPLTVSDLSAGVHVISASVMDSGGLGATTQLTLSVNAAPVVTIVNPVSGSSMTEGDVLTLAGTAHDLEDGDLSAGLNWNSSLVGTLGTGASVPVSELPAGVHLIQASVSDHLGASGSAEISFTVSANAPPEVTILTPADGTEVTQGDPLTLVGSASDAEDGDLASSVTWTSDRDGPLGTGASVTRSDLSLGAHVITASVADRFEASASAALSVTVKLNAAPQVLIATPTDGTSVTERDPVTFSGSASDAEDGDLSAGLVWASDQDGLLGSGATVTRSDLSVGVHTITATVTDHLGEEGNTAFTLIVNANTSPTVSISAPPDLFSVTEGDAVTFVGSAIDLEQGDLSAALTWSSNLDGSIGSGASVTRADLTIGVHTIRASAEDQLGAVGSAVTTLTVNANDGPQVTITAPESGAVRTAGTPVSLTGIATDAEDGDVSDQLAWSSNLQGPLGIGASVTRADLVVGVHTITASVADQLGAVGSSQTSLTVNPNQPPLLAITAPADGSVVTEASTFTLMGNASDPEDGDLSDQLTWTSSLDGPLGEGASVTRSDLSVGLHTITASVVDSLGEGGTQQLSLRINAAPIVSLNAPDEGSIWTEGASVAFAAAASDLEDGDLSHAVAWTSSLDGFLGSGPSLARSDLSPGLHTISASVADSFAAPGAASVGIRINAAPVVAITAPADGAVVTEGSPLVLVGSAADAEDGDLSAQLVWNSSLDGSLGTGASINRSDLSVGVHAITAQLSDTFGVTGSAEIAVQINAAPVVTIIAPADGVVVTEGSVLVLEAGAVDTEEGDLSAQITWTSSLDGDLGSGESVARSDLSVGVHTISATVVDGSGASGAAQLSAQINAAPEISITAPADGSIVTQLEELILLGVASDSEDGDLSAQILWTSSSDGPLGEGSSVTRSDLSVGVHQITASITDRFGVGASAVLSLRVNASPVVAIVSPSDGAVITELEPVTLVATASDPEDLELAARVEWTSSVNGPLGTGASVTRADLSVGLHEISASVLDDDGASAVALITLRINAAPVVAITAPAPGSSAALGDPLLLGAGAADLEDGDLSASVVWTSDLDGSLGSGASLGVSLSLGTHTITASVVDDLGAGASDQLVLTVTTAPVVQILAPPDGSVVTEGAAIELSAGASDAEDGDLSASVAWASSRDGALGSGSSITTSSLSVGLHEIAASVTDANGITRGQSIGLRVNAAPVVGISSPPDGASVTERDVVTLQGVASDLEDGDLSSELSWTSSLDGLLGSGALVVRDDLSVGTHTISATVSDAFGVTRSVAITLQVNLNTLPVVTITSPEDGAGVSQGDVVLEGTAIDAEQGDISDDLVWTSSKDGPVGTGRSVPATLSFGNQRITASVTDEKGATVSATITLKIKNR